MNTPLGKPSLKTGILVVGGIGVLAILYVIVSALVSSSQGPMDSYAVGPMREFRTVSAPPIQGYGERHDDTQRTTQCIFRAIS